MRLYKHLFGAAVTAVFMLTPASGALIEGTLNQPGDLTIDTDQNLEFLTLSATRGISYNQALATSFVTQDGFRTGTLSEFEQLATNAGVPDLSGTFSAANFAGVETLISSLGATIPGSFTLPNGVTIARGFYSFLNAPGVPPGSVNVSGADYQSAALGQADQDQGRVLPMFNQFGVDQASPIAGTLLVRTATPEPASVGTLGLGLTLFAGLWMLRRRARS